MERFINFGFDATMLPGVVEAPNTGAGSAGQEEENTTYHNPADREVVQTVDEEGGVMFRHPGEVTRMTPVDRAYRHIANTYATQGEE